MQGHRERAAFPQRHSARSEMSVLGNLQCYSQHDSEWFFNGIISAFLAGILKLLTVVFNKGEKISHPSSEAPLELLIWFYIQSTS